MYFGVKLKLTDKITFPSRHSMHRQASGGHHNNPAAAGNVGSSPEGNEGESDFVMVPEHLTMDAAEVRYIDRQKECGRH